MDWYKKRVFVTGAGGFIGSHLTEQLALRGADVRAFIRYNSRGDWGLLKLLPADILSKIDVVAGDLRDPHLVNELVSDREMVFHLGALISIPYSYHNPYEVAETNVMGTLNVLMACKKTNVGKLIHTSTSEVYGTAQYVPINEAHPLQGQSPYSASKIGADKLAESFYRSFGLPVVTVRPFNTYGPRQSNRAVIPTIITQALTQKKISIGNVETTRDFTYVSDTVSGFLHAAEAGGVEGGTFNLGTGHEIKIKDLAELIIQKIDPAIQLEIDPERMRPNKSEVYRLISDNSRARNILGWEPKFGLEEGLDKTILWIMENLKLYHIGKYEL